MSKTTTRKSIKHNNSSLLNPERNAVFLIFVLAVAAVGSLFGTGQEASYLVISDINAPQILQAADVQNRWFNFRYAVLFGILGAVAYIPIDMVISIILSRINKKT